jgi:zinc transporter
MGRADLIPDRFGPEAGLLWGLRFSDNKTFRVTPDTLDACLADSSCWLWMHFALSDHRARKYIGAFAEAPQAARDLLLGQERRPQVHAAGAWAYGILPDIERDFEGHTLGVGRLNFAMNERFLLTARHHALRAVDAVRDAALGGETIATPADCVIGLVETFTEMVEARLHALTLELDRIEDLVLSDGDDVPRLPLGPARRELSRYYREFAGLRSALNRALTSRNESRENSLFRRLPALAQRIDDFDRDVSALQDRARLLYEEMDTRIAATTNRSVQALTIMSTLLIPPTFVVGAFGMNLPGIPWARDAQGFAVAIGLCAVVVVISYAVLRRFKILP